MTLTVSSEQIDLTREPPFRLGAMEVIPAAREVVVEDRREVLEPRIMQVLVALARRRDEVVTRDELIVMCWSGRVVGEDAITRCIGRVRRLSETGGGFCLETIPRLGYRLTEINAAPPVAGESPPVELPPPWLVRHRRLVFWGFLAAAVALALGLAIWLMRPAADVPPVKLTIAVLPFTAPPGDREAEQLGDAIAVGIADALVREGLNVVSPARTRQFRGSAKADAAQVLHADFVIDGEIRREGGMFNVPVRTIEGAGGTTLVARTVEVPVSEAASVPELAVVAAMGSGWGLLSALDSAAKADVRVVGGSLKVITHFANRSEAVYAYDVAKQLAASAPGNAYAQYLHAMTAASFIPDRAADQRLPLVIDTREAVRKTLQLDPNFGEAYVALARATPMFDWTRREGYLRQGLRLRPTSPLTYMDLLALRMNAGYLRQGANMAEDAFSNHPPFDNTMFEAINARLWLGDPEGARRLIVRGLTLYPHRVAFAAKMFEATALNGAPADAEAFLKTPAAAPLVEPQGEGRTYNAIVSALRRGRLADKKTVAADCLKAQSHTHEFRRICFMALVKLGQLDDAYRMAKYLYPDQRGASEAEVESRWLSQLTFNTVYLVIPLTAPLRADTRYRDLAERVGLLRYWKERGTAPDFCASENVPLCRELKS